jgi:hypothetical protein
MRFNRKIICSAFILFCLHAFAYAQQALNIRGIIFKTNSQDRVAQVLITNMKSQVPMISDELGGFSIKASIGDTLLFSKIDYMPQKVAVANNNDQIIYMQPVVKLNGVTIKDKTNSLELNEVINHYRNKGLYFDGRPPIWIFNPISGSPLTGFHELLGKDAANDRRFIRFSKSESEAVEVDKRYNRELVKHITKLPDEEIEKFTEAFRPSYSDIKRWNDYQLIQYIQDSFNYYNKNKPGIKSQALN